jgi:hypothetical protein
MEEALKELCPCQSCHCQVGEGGQRHDWQLRATLPSHNSKAGVMEFEDSIQCLNDNYTKGEFARGAK